jgi:hypothetical protein
VVPFNPSAVLEPTTIKDLSEGGVAICADGGRLLVLTASGTRILSVDTNFNQMETIPLNRRLVPPRGIGADRYYIYLYDDNVLYRLAKDKLTMQELLGNVRVAGLANYAPGEVLVSEGERQFVLLKTLFGESRVFLDKVDVTRPGAMTNFPNGVWGILSASDRLVKVNRAGIVVKTAKLPPGVDVLAADKWGRAVVLKRGEPVVWVDENGKFNGYGLGGAATPTGCAVLDGQFVILDNGNRLISYRLPALTRPGGKEAEHENGLFPGR